MKAPGAAGEIEMTDAASLLGLFWAYDNGETEEEREAARLQLADVFEEAGHPDKARVYRDGLDFAFVPLTTEWDTIFDRYEHESSRDMDDRLSEEELMREIIVEAKVFGLRGRAVLHQYLCAEVDGTLREVLTYVGRNLKEDSDWEPASV